MLTNDKLPPLPKCDIYDPNRFGVGWREASLRAYGQSCQAAATAEARALVGQMLKALETCRWYSDDDGQIEQGFLDIPVDQAKAAARAWLSEAQKGDGLTSENRTSSELAKTGGA